MPDAQSPLNEQQLAARRGVRRTVALLTVIVVAIFVAFILTGVLGRVSQ